MTGRATAPGLNTRAAATGEHLEHLHEAARRLDSVAQVLAAVELDHSPVEIDQLLPAVINAVDVAIGHIARAGEE